MSDYTHDDSIGVTVTAAVLFDLLDSLVESADDTALPPCSFCGGRPTAFMTFYMLYLCCRNPDCGIKKKWGSQCAHGVSIAMNGVEKRPMVLLSHLMNLWAVNNVERTHIIRFHGQGTYLDTYSVKCDPSMIKVKK